MMRNVVFIVVAVGVYWGLKYYYGDRDGTASDMPNKVSCGCQWRWPRGS